MKAEKCSQSMADFVSFRYSLVGLYAVVLMVLDQNEVLKKAARALVSGEPKDEKDVLIQFRLNRCPWGRTDWAKFLREHESMWNELVFNRFVDHLYLYLSDILTEVLLFEPNLLKGEGTVPVTVALELGSKEAITKYLAEKKVKDLSYKSLAEVMEYFEKRVGIDLQIEPGIVRDVVEIVERRHLLVHNGGRVDAKYISRTGSELQIDDRVEIDSSYMWPGIHALEKFIAQFDDSVCSKFEPLRLAQPETHIIMPKEFLEGSDAVAEPVSSEDELTDTVMPAIDKRSSRGRRKRPQSEPT